MAQHPAVEIHGAGDPVILVHGLGGTSNVFTPQVGALSRFFQCVRFDLPGSGRSAVTDDVSISGFIDAVVAVLDSRGIERAHVVGHSLGTVVCQHLAVRQPERVRSLSLIGPLHAPPEAARPALRDRATKARAEGMVGIADAVVQGGTSADTKANRPEVAAFVREILMRQDPEGYARTCEALAAAEPADVARIACPTLLITGDEDGTAPPPRPCGPWRRRSRDRTCAFSIVAAIGRRSSVRQRSTKRWSTSCSPSPERLAEKRTAVVEATGYVTEAERVVDGSGARVRRPSGSVVFVDPASQAGNSNTWWRLVPEANWRHPEGPGSDIGGRENHPVVHVTYNDAIAYARWLGRELPTEAQWEHAARGGLDGAPYAWGGEFTPQGVAMANTWQGVFPIQNTRGDGYPATAPVGCFTANGYGLRDMIGNVWEWTSDWYRPRHDGLGDVNPTGPRQEDSHDPRQPGVPSRVIKGGSFLCAQNFCQRYWPASRHPQDVGLGASHLGFRTVLNTR